MSQDLRYHHIGIPTEVPREGEVYLEKFKMYASGFDISRFGVEWLRFESDAPFPNLVKTTPHVAFVVEDLDTAFGAPQNSTCKSWGSGYGVRLLDRWVADHVEG